MPNDQGLTPGENINPLPFSGEEAGNKPPHSQVHHCYDKLLAAIMQVTRSVGISSSACICEIKEAVQHAITTVLRRTVSEHELLGVLDEMLTLSGHAHVGASAGKAHTHSSEHHHRHCHNGDMREHFSSLLAPDAIMAVGVKHMDEKERQLIELLVKELGSSQSRLKEEEASSHTCEPALSPAA